MGGLNHKPTKHASFLITVPMSAALSKIGIYLLQANVAIEECILTPATSYGAGRGHLGESVVFMAAARSQASIFIGYGKQMLGLLGVGDYEPFMPTSTIDVDAFYAECVANGLVPDTKAARDQLELLKDGGYTAAFTAYVDAATVLEAQLEILETLTVTMRDGVAGFQGLFWDQVECNAEPWRQAYAKALTAYTNLLGAFQADAMVSTETFLVGMGHPGLMTNVAQVTTQVGTMVG